MNPSTRLLLPLLLASLAAGGCGDAKSDDAGSGDAGSRDAGSRDAGSGDAGSGDAGRTACYVPTPASGEDGYVATVAVSEHTFEFQLPDDPEGGLVTVTISGRQIFSDVRVEGAGDDGFLSINGVATDTVGTFTRTFVGAPGVTYLVDVNDTYAREEQDSPVELTWELSATRDCFEPNDTPASAAPFALGEDVVAYLFAGYTTNDWPGYEDHHDYYAVEIEAAGTLTVTVDPGPDELALAVFSANAPSVSLGDSWSLDETAITVALEVEPGTYLVRIAPFVLPIYDSFAGEPTQWNQPYTLRATVE